MKRTRFTDEQVIGSPSMNVLDGRLEGGTFVAGDLRFPLTGYAFRTAPREGIRLKLGIRPEHVLTDPSQAITEAQVDFVEPMGADTLVWLNLAGTSFAVRLDGRHPVKVGDRLPLGVDIASASLFDAETGDRL